MRIAYFLTTAIQFVFIALVFVIVFHRPKYETQENVLGLSIDVEETLRACRADLNKDTYIDDEDFKALQSEFLNLDLQTLKYDITGDNIVDLSDYAYLYRTYGQRCL